MNLLIFGASGATGHQVVAQALGAGHQVTAFVRTPEKLKVTRSDRLHLVQGDVADAAAVARAVGGHDAVVSTLGGKPLQHDQAVIDGIGHILGAMEDAKVPRFVYLSFTGVKDVRGMAGLLIRPVVGFLLRHEIADHQAKEALIRASGLSWTIVQAPKLTNRQATGRYEGGVDLEAPTVFPTLSRADLADFLLAQAEDTRFVRQTVRIYPAV